MKDTSSKYNGNIQKWSIVCLCLRGTLCSSAKTGFESLVQKDVHPTDTIPEGRILTTNLKGIWLNKEENSNRFTSKIRKQNQRQSI